VTVGEERAWGWVAHLREGGTTPWRDWSGQRESQGRYLPGAQQLELLRRLNAAGRPTPLLVDAVLAASAAGRGRPDLELAGAGPEPEFGPRPVDPAGLPAGELVRVAASVLADQLLDADEVSPVGRNARPEAGLPGVGDQSPRRVARPGRWRRGYRLVGDPGLAEPLRAQLVARGRVPGGRDPRILAVGTDLATMTGHAWTHRATTEGVAAWPTWLGLLRERRQLPPRVDLLAVCRTWERRVGKERVHVVLDLAAVPGLAGHRRALTPPATAPGEVGELSRRVCSVLGLLVLPDARERLLTDRLRPRLETAVREVRGARPLVVPEAHRDRLERAAERMRTGIRRAGYAVHGDLDALVPVWPSGQDGPPGPSPEATLDLAVRVLLLPEGRTA
jgi:hypothetical protein